MSINNEIEIYSMASPTEHGEVKIFDDIIFQKAIRKREIDIVKQMMLVSNPKRVLDFGCGGGWLTKALSDFNCEIIGIDIAKSLVANSRKVNPNHNFLVANCMKLPFDGGSFDLIIGMGILHHLNIRDALHECHRVLKPGGQILFMEPNAMNLLMAIGRKIIPSEIHTKDEKPIYSSYVLRELSSAGYILYQIKYLFPISICISYMLAKAQYRFAAKMAEKCCDSLIKIEKIYESIPLINKTAGVIVIIASKTKSGLCICSTKIEDAE